MKIELNHNLATRNSAQSIFNKCRKEKIKELNFEDVEVVSRSFVNEFMILEEEFSYSIIKKNMSKDVKFMFDNARKILDSDVLSKNKYTVESVDKYLNLI